MKKVFILFSCILLQLPFVLCFGRNLDPVAVDDTLHVYTYDDTLTINVTHNDYDPEGDPFHIIQAPGSVGFTDSTISYYFSYFGYSLQDTITRTYIILGSYYAEGTVFIIFHKPPREYLEVNGVKAIVENTGFLFMDKGNMENTYEVPAGSGIDAIFGMSPWISGLDPDDSIGVAAQFGNTRRFGYFPGPVSDTLQYSMVFDTLWDRVWNITRTEIEYHKSHWWTTAYTAPEAILSWPGNGDTSIGQANILAPFYDENNNGIYDPLMGDYPIIRGDQTIFFIMKDSHHSDPSSDKSCMNVEIHCWAYAFDCPADTALHFTTFLHFEIYNRSNNTYHNTYLGLYTDGDIGNAYDDYIGCDVERGSMFFYNGDAFDEEFFGELEYGMYPPAISATILAGPYLDPDNIDNPKTDGLGNPLCDLSLNATGFGDNVVDNERIGLTGFMSIFMNQYNPFPGPTGISIDDALYYFRYMRSYALSGEKLQYGCKMHGLKGVECNYMYPALTDPCNFGSGGIQPPGYATGAGGTDSIWAEYECGNEPYDRGGIASSGPFTFHPGDKQELDIAFVWARQFADTNPEAALSVLQNRIDQVREYFLKDSTPCGASFTGTMNMKPPASTLKVYPNPTNSILNIEYENRSGKAEYIIFSITGSVIRNGTLENRDMNQVDVQQLNKGLYILLIREKDRVQSKRFIRN